MTRFTTLSRQFGMLVFALMVALGLLAPQAANAALPPADPSVLSPGNIVYPPIFAADAIYNVQVSAPQYNKGAVTATVSFDTIMGARAMINWGPQCWNNVCEFPLPAGFNGYDEKGYFVKHSIGSQMEPANSTLTHHVFTLTDLVSDAPYEFFISVDLVNSHVHWYYGRFQSGELIIT